MSEPSDNAETITARGVLKLGDDRVEAEFTVPKRPVPLGDLIPICRSLTEAIVDRAVARVAAEGRTVSCRKGCGACCRQLVPLTEPEARRIRDLVESLPEPRRSTIRARFAEVRERLERSGEVGAKLLHPERFSDDELKARDLGLAYFRLGIPCPFLEDESCSIHPDRPMACREYLVTSPAEFCADPSADTVRVVQLPAKVSTAVTLIGVPEDGSRRFIRWVALSLALDWADDHPDDLPPRPGPDWIRELIARLTGKEVPPPPTGSSD